DGLADVAEVLDVVGRQLHAELVLDDLGQLDEVQRVDVEVLEGRLPRDRLALGSQLSEAVEDHLLDVLRTHLCWHRSVSFLVVSFSEGALTRSARRPRSGSFR